MLNLKNQLKCKNKMIIKNERAKENNKIVCI